MPILLRHRELDAWLTGKTGASSKQNDGLRSLGVRVMRAK
jgi:hypothetical protein